MLDRTACERRVYRLATLLTGHPLAATRVITAVVDAQPDLRSLDSAHLDRLTVLRSREIPSGTLVDDAIDPKVAEAFAGLDSQAREAWIFARVYRVVPRESARAMDCSTSAGKAHLERADAAIGRVGDREAFADALREYSLALDVPAFYREDRARRMRVRRMLQAVGLVAAAAAIVVIGLVWHRMTSGG